MEISVDGKCIKLGSLSYSIEVVDGLWQESGEHGASHHNTLRIRVERKQHPQKFNETVHHEIIHAVDAVFNNHNLPEDTVSAMGAGLAQVFSDFGICFVP